jgi:signal transduction histidine kinase
VDEALRPGADDSRSTPPYPHAVDALRWLRRDLGKPEVPTTRVAFPFLAGSALGIITISLTTDPGTAADLLIIGVAGAAFIARALIPRLPAELFAVLVLVPVAVVVSRDGALEGTFFLSVMMVLATAWHLGSLTRATLIAGVAAAIPPWVASVLPDADIGWEAWTSAVVFTLSMGRLLYRQERLIEALEDAREALAEQAVAEERRRIARELHDLAGHTLAAVLLHVTGARHILHRDSREAERALVDAETVGRASLDQIRATVAALRTDERGTDPSLAGSADLGDLVDEYRRAGLDVTTDVADPAIAIDGPTGTALHRIAREALANVARHAPTNRVELTLATRDGWAELTVVDRGRAAAPADDAPDHFGLVGMRERARALGGRLDAGPTDDGWCVRADLPLIALPQSQPSCT